MPWQLVRDQVLRMRAVCPSHISEKRSLLDIIAFADANNVRANYAVIANISNLVEIVPQAKRAIQAGNLERLSELFRLAATHTNKDLRLILGTATPASVNVSVSPSGYTLTLTHEQLSKIQRGMKLQFKFNVGEL